MASSSTSKTIAAILACGIALTAGVMVGRRTAPAAAATATPTPQEEKEKGEKEGERREVVLSEEGLVAARLQFGKASKRPLARSLGLTGQVDFHPDRVATLGAKIPARIAKVHVGVGDTVTVGQALAVLDSMELAKARGTFAAAIAKRTAAQAAFNRAESLHADGVVPARQVEETKSELAIATAEVAAARGTLVALGVGEGDAGSASSLVTLRAPIAGKIVRRDAVIGQSVDGTTSIFTIADLAEVWVLLDVFERDIPRVQPGTEVALTTNAQPDRVVEGKVSFVSEVLDEKSRTVKARVVAANTDGSLKPGMFVHATLKGAAAAAETEGAPVLVVPVSAVQRIGDDDYVFVRVAPRKFQARAVALGERSAGFVVVRRGLREGDEVVTEGALTLKAELEKASFGDDD